MEHMDDPSVVLWDLKRFSFWIVPSIVGCDGGQHGEAIVAHHGEDEGDDQEHPESDGNAELAVSAPAERLLHIKHMQPHLRKSEANGKLSIFVKSGFGWLQHAKVRATK